MAEHTRLGMELTISADLSVYAPAPRGCSEVYAPCPDPDCARPCGKRPDPSVIIAPSQLQSILYGVAVSLMGLSVLAGIGAIAEQGIENNRAVIAANMEP